MKKNLSLLKFKKNYESSDDGLDISYVELQERDRLDCNNQEFLSHKNNWED